MFKIIVEPSSEPVKLDEVKSAIGIMDEDESEDLNIFNQIITARKWVEGYLNRALITQTLEMAYSKWPDTMYLEQMPVQSVTTITYTDDDGATQTVDTAYYSLDTHSVRHNVFLNYDYEWPDAREITNSIKVRYVSGYGDNSTSVPEGIKNAIYTIIDNWVRYNPRSDNGLPMMTIPHAAEQLLYQYKVDLF